MQEQRKRRERVKPGIYKRLGVDGKPVFEIGYRDSDGKQRWQRVHGGVRAAEAALADIKARRGKGERVAPSPRLTFAEAAEAWMEAQGARLRPATQAAYGSSLRMHLLPRWGRRRLDQLDVDDVARLIEDMQRAGYKPWTIRGVLTPAGRVFDFARRRLGWAGANPVRALDKGERPRHEQRDRRILSRDELASLLAAAESPHREIIATAASLGTRLGETLGLTWRDLDLHTGTASVTHQISRTGERVELKTARSRRVVEMPASLAAMLREHRLRSPYSRDDDLVFASRTGGPLEHRNVAQRGLARAVKKAGLDSDHRPPTFHELRHTHASAWIASGGDLVELSARLGHRDPAVTASVYSHEFEAASRSDERRRRLDDLYGSAMEAAAVSTPQPTTPEGAADVLDLRRNRDVSQ